MSWAEVTKSKPCRICGKGDWCATSENNELCRCERAEVAPPGWTRIESGATSGQIFRTALATVPNGAHRHQERPKMSSAEVEAMASACRKALSDERLAELAAALDVRPENLVAVGVGWLESEGCWTFEERDGESRLVGINRRFPNGDKMRMRGTSAGLTLPAGWERMPGPVLVVEGPSDVCAGLDVGLPCIGRPSNSGGATMLAQLLRGHAERVVIVGENDVKPDGRWPGREGMNAVARRIAEAWGRPVRTWMPPPGAKDLRELVRLQREDGKADSEVRRFVLDSIEHEAESSNGPMSVVAAPSGQGAGWTEEGIEREDAGNAARFARMARGRVLWCPEWSRWLVWDGQVWKSTDETGVMTTAMEVGASRFDDVKKARGDEERKALAQFAVKAHRKERILAMLHLAKAPLRVSQDQLDADGEIINCANGMLHLPSGTLRPHDPWALCTRICNGAHRPGVERPVFDRFIAEVLGHDDDVIGFVQRLFGAALFGTTSKPQLLPLLHGPGANGKSRFIEAVLHAMGGYSVVAAPDLLTEGGDSHPTAVADLVGRRLVVVNELEAGARLRIARMKSLVGDATLKARVMRGDYFEFTRRFLPVIVTNNKPRVTEGSEAVWRRIRLLGFNVVIPEARRDVQLGEKLAGEVDGVLTWLAEGASAWAADGLQEPATVTTATAEYKVEEDVIGQFLAEQGTRDPQAWTANRDLRAAYVSWCDALGIRAVSAITFGREMARSGFEAGQRGPTKGWFGVKLGNLVAASNP